MATEIYVRLTYDQYKRLEEQLRDFAALETTHESGNMDKKFYHKSLRFDLGDITVEAHGPLVKP